MINLVLTLKIRPPEFFHSTKKNYLGKCATRKYIQERDINLFLNLCKYIRSPSFFHSIKSSLKMRHKELYLLNDQSRSHPYISGLPNSFILQKKIILKTVPQENI